MNHTRSIPHFQSCVYLIRIFNWHLCNLPICRASVDCTALTTRHAATHYHTLQHTTTHCNTLQHTAPHCTTLHHTAPQCTTLHHTASHCTTLHHTAPHCSTVYIASRHPYSYNISVYCSVCRASVDTSLRVARQKIPYAPSYCVSHIYAMYSLCLCVFPICRASVDASAHATQQKILYASSYCVSPVYAVYILCFCIFPSLYSERRR